MNRGFLLELPEARWECPLCNLQDVTREARPHTRMHPCPALGGLTAPMVHVTGSELDRRAQNVTLAERDDYIGNEIVQYAHGRPVMALNVERADGSNDRLVYAPTAQRNPHD